MSILTPVWIYKRHERYNVTERHKRSLSRPKTQNRQSQQQDPKCPHVSLRAVNAGLTILTQSVEVWFLDVRGGQNRQMDKSCPQASLSHVFVVKAKHSLVCFWPDLYAKTCSAMSNKTEHISCTDLVVTYYNL